MNRIAICIALIAATACTAEPPEVGRVEGYTQWDGDAGISEIPVDLDAGYTVTNVDLNDEDERIKYWRERTGCQLTPDEFFDMGEETERTVSTFESESEGDGWSARTFRACGQKYFDAIHWEYDAHICTTCCGWWIQCFPLTGCEWFFSCASTDCYAVGP